MCRQLADDDCTSRPQPRDHGGIARCDMVHPQLRMAGCGLARDVDDILDPDRHTVERATRPARSNFARRDHGISEGGFAIKPDKGVQHRIELVYPRQHILHQLKW